jgi:hypothetical protein
MEITAAKAREFLESNLSFERGHTGTNRPVSIRTVNRYALSMLKGEWRLTHQGIGFDLKKNLKDGQHRLLAIVQAAEEGATEGETKYDPMPKIKVKMQVTWGLSEDVFDILDTGLARSSNQILAIAGYANQSHLSAAARLLYMFDEHEFKFWRSVKVTNHQVLETVQRSGIDEYIPVCTQLTPMGFIAAAATVGYYVAERAYPDGPHQQFIEDLKTGAGLANDSPALALRNYMIKSRSVGRVRRDAHTHLAMYIKAWNDVVEKRKRDKISWRTGEPFPKPIEK